MGEKFKVLVLYYSQTGKTKSLLDIFLEPLQKRSDVEITIEEILPKVPFPFPWPQLYFFSLVPECVYEVPIELQEMKFNENEKYDLIILGYQVWFLAPSIPTNSLLKHPKAKVFANTPVVSVLFCRNMWRQAQGRLERRLEELQSWVVDKVVTTAYGSQMETLRSTKQNLLQKPKIGEDSHQWRPSPEDVEITKKQGIQLADSIWQIKENPKRPIFKDSSRALKDTMFVYPEQKAKESFFAWGGYFLKHSSTESTKRKIFIILFCWTFFFKVFVLLPLFPILKKLREKAGKNNSEIKILDIPSL
ncbi:MAG: hypothetical protein HUU50_12350 [Candidatus Brocadiae bacterium]|nr:hypothetical protein [Candidatus Brocadiia bacterium]